MSALKAFMLDDYGMIYAAIDEDHATQLFESDSGELPDDGYPREMTEAELDAEHPDYDEDEMPTGGTITLREILAEHPHGPGYLCGGDQ